MLRARARTRALLLAAALSAAALSSVPAAAHADAATDQWVVSFEGPAHFVQTGPDGPTVPDDYVEAVTLECSAVECVYTNAHPFFPEYRIALSAQSTASSASWGESGDLCAGTRLGAGTATATFAGTSLTIVTEVAASGWQDCPGGRDYGFAQELTVAAEWTTGDLCALNGDVCAGADGGAGEVESDLLTYDTGADDYLLVECAGTSCVLRHASMVTADVIEAAPAFPVPGTLSYTVPAIPMDCSGGRLRGETSVDLVFDAEGVSGTIVEEGFEYCDEFPQTHEGFAAEVSGVLSDGACYFTADGCAIALPDGPDPIGDDETAAAADPGTQARGSASRLASGDPAAPSVLSALVTPAHAITSPTQLLLAALLTVILVLLMSFPTSLLNRAVDAGSDRLSTWWKTRNPAGPADDPAAPSPRRWASSWWWAAIGVLIAAVISSFVDPQFGLNPGSLRVFVSIAVGFAVDVMVGWVAVIWLTRRFVPGATYSFSFQPLSLIVVVAAVVFTRLTGFEPGIVFGLVAGVSFGAIVGTAATARSSLVGFGWAFLLAIVSWFCYGLAAPLSGGTVGGTLLVETLASLTIGGIVGLPLGLVPLRGLGGHKLWVWNRRVWAGCYAVGLLAFFIVLMPMPFSWGEVGWELWTWIGMYLAYAAVAVTAWLVVVRPWRSGEAPGPQAEATESVPAEVGEGA